MNKRLTGYIVLLIILITLFSLQSLRMTNQYSVWKGHYDLLDDDNKTIQDWMTINLIEKHFSIEFENIFDKLKIEDTGDNRRLTLKEICIKYTLDCNRTITELEK